MTFDKGQRVSTPYGPGTVAYQRLSAPAYIAAEVVSVVLDVKRTQPGYLGTVFPAGDVAPITYVYILFHETNTGDAASESDGYVESVHATEDGAKAELKRVRDEAIAAGKSVWNDETEEPTDWEHDWRIDTRQVEP